MEKTRRQRHYRDVIMQDLNEAQHEILNDLRQEKLYKIDEIKEIKLWLELILTNFNTCQKWTHVIDETTLSFEKKM